MNNVRVERNGNVRTVGPLSEMDVNRYNAAAPLKYPLDLSTQNQHYIKFNINIPEQSKYSKSGGGGTSVADINRSRTNQISNSQDPFSASALGASALANFGGIAGGIAAGLVSGTRAGILGSIFGAGVDFGITAGALSFVDLQRKTKRLAQEIFLYVPDTVQQTTANKWTGVSLTEALGTAGFAAQGLQAASGADFTKLLSEEGAAAKLGAGRNPQNPGSPTGGVVGEVMGKAAAASGQFGAGIDKVMMASAGFALNPQIEILFDSVDNRTFQFDFKFSPRSQAEAKEILNIIKAFRYHAAPELSGGGTGAGGGRYFVPPSEFDITYYFGSKENPALHKFSTCVLEGIDVNYSNGNFATYDDGVPVEIGMTLRFLEVEILHKELIAKGY